MTITDSIGCTLLLYNPAILNEGEPATPYLGQDTVICANQSLVLTPGAFSSYLWQDNSTGPTFAVSKPGYYFVSVKNSNRCIGKDSVLVTLQPDCGDVFFPKLFTPNGDNRNDLFGVVGNIALISNYKLAVYNRYGGLIISTTNPSTKWDGTYKNKTTTATTYVWHVSNLYFQGSGSAITIRNCNSFEMIV